MYATGTPVTVRKHSGHVMRPLSDGRYEVFVYGLGMYVFPARLVTIR